MKDQTKHLCRPSLTLAYQFARHSAKLSFFPLTKQSRVHYFRHWEIEQLSQPANFLAETWRGWWGSGTVLLKLQYVWESLGRFWIRGDLRWGLKLCLSNKLPGVGDAGGPYCYLKEKKMRLLGKHPLYTSILVYGVIWKRVGDFWSGY